MTSFRENSRNVHFWAEKANFGPKGPKRAKRDFRAKSENATTVALGSPNFVPNFRKFLNFRKISV